MYEKEEKDEKEKEEQKEVVNGELEKEAEPKDSEENKEEVRMVQDTLNKVYENQKNIIEEGNDNETSLVNQFVEELEQEIPLGSD